MRDYLEHLSQNEKNHLSIQSDNTSENNREANRLWADILVKILEDRDAPTPKETLQKIFVQQTGYSKDAFFQAEYLATREGSIVEARRRVLKLSHVDDNRVRKTYDYFGEYHFCFNIKSDTYPYRANLDIIQAKIENQPLFMMSDFDPKTGIMSGSIEGKFHWSDKLEIFQKFYYNREDNWNNLYEGEVRFRDLNPDVEDTENNMEIYLFRDGIIMKG